MEHKTHGGHYGRLLAMIALSFVSMYVLMYAMVDRFDNVLPNLNQFFMAGLMAAPMGIIELLLMRSMYPDRRLNIGILVACTIALVVFWVAIRQQIGIDDRQFLKSMIPHHAGAILMCEQAPLQDARVRQLCGRIIESQREEIALMKEMLRENELREGPRSTQ